jgi:hypothetical protein
VLIGLTVEQQATLGQVTDQRFVGVLEEQPADHRHRFREPPVRPDRVDHRQAVGAAGLHVVRAECG